MKQKKQTLWFGLLASVLLIFSAKNSFALFELGLLGGVNRSMPVLSSSVSGVTLTPDSQYGTQYGGFIAIPLIPMLFNLEINGLYSQYKYSAAASVSGLGQSFSTNGVLTLNRLMVPVIARFTLAPIFEIGAGPYLAFAMGEVSGAAGATSYAATGLATYDFGVTGSVRFKKSLAPTLSFLIDGRYNYALRNSSTVTSTSMKANSADVLMGLSIGI